MSALRWLWDNKTWLFSGIGVVVLTIFARPLINAFTKPSQGGTSQKQRARAGTSVMQAGRDINVNVGPQPQLPAVRVLVHRAYFVSNPMEYFFIKIVNVTAGSDVEVTHVWYQNGARVDILIRPLPVRLRPNQTWETYVPTRSIPDDLDVFEKFHAMTSIGQVFASEHNKDVPSVGYVAGP